MTNAYLGLNDIQSISVDDEEEENYGRCESPVLSKIIHRSQLSIKEMTPDDPELVEAARNVLTPQPATPQPQTGHDVTATVPVEQSVVIPSFSIDKNLVPCTAKIPESLCDLLNFENTSWTSSLATPHGQNVTYSNLNTEEKKVLVSSKPVPRTLFTPEVKEEQSQKSLNESLMECSEILHNVNPKRLCRVYKEFSNSEDFSLNDASQNSTVLTGIEKYPDISVACSTSTKEPHLVREVLDLLVSPVTASRQKTCSKSEPLSETPSHNSSYKYVCELGKLSKLRPKAKRLFRKGNETCSGGESDTTVNGDQINSDTFSHTTDISKDMPISPNLYDTHIFASPISPVVKAKANDTQQKDGVMSYSPVLNRTQEFLHDFSFSTLEEVCQASEVLASSCTSPVENCENSDNFLTQKIIHSVSPIEFEGIASRRGRLVVNKTSTPIHTERNKKISANKKKIKFLNVHQGQKQDSPVTGSKEKFGFLCKPQVSSGVTELSKCGNGLLQCNDNSVNKNSSVELNNAIPNTTESLRHRVVSVKSNANQKLKFSYFSELETSNTANITRFPSVDTMLRNVLQSAEALEAVSLLQNENIGTALKKHFEQISRKETDFVPFNEWNPAPSGQLSTSGNFANTCNSMKNFNILEEDSKISLGSTLHKTLGDHTNINGRKRKSGSHGTVGDQCTAKKICIKECNSVQVQDVFKRPDSSNVQPYVSDTQLNVVFDNVESIVAKFNTKCDVLGTAAAPFNTPNLGNFHTENKRTISLLENKHAFSGENYFDKENIETEQNEAGDGENRTEIYKTDKNEITMEQNPVELKTENHYNVKSMLPNSEKGSDGSVNLNNKLKKDVDTSEDISFYRGSTKSDSVAEQCGIKKKIHKVCKFISQETEECVSEEPVAEVFSDTSFLHSFQHIFDSSFTAVTQKTTEFIGKEKSKGEALFNCELNNSVECNFTDETIKGGSLVIGPMQNLSENTSESAGNSKAGEYALNTESNTRETSHFSINSESNNSSESHQHSRKMDMAQVLKKKDKMVIPPTICNAGSHNSNIQMDNNSKNENLKHSSKLPTFNHDRQCERISGSDNFLQTQSTVSITSVANGEGGLCAQSNILDPKVSDRTECGMFTTAKGKKIEISSKCLDVACNLFRDIIEPNIEQIDGQNMDTAQQKATSETVTIRDGNLTKHQVSKNNDKRHCKENDEKNDSSEMQGSKIKLRNQVNRNATVALPLQVGFSTASGKKFTISEKSLHKARHIFETVMELETTGDENFLEDYDVFGIGNMDTEPSLNRNQINLEICNVLTDKATHLSRQFQNKVGTIADASSNGKTLQHARMPQSVGEKQTMLSEFCGDICVTAGSHLSKFQKKLDEKKKHNVKFKTNSSTHNMANGEWEDINALALVSESNELFQEIDSATASKIELDVKSKKVESGFTTAAGERLFIPGKALDKAKKVFSDIVTHHSSESKDCNTGIECSDSAYERNYEADYTIATNDKGHPPKSSSCKTVQAMLNIKDNNNFLNTECDTVSVSTEKNAADLLMSSSTVAGSMVGDVKAEFQSTFMTRTKSDATSLQKLIKVDTSIKYPDNFLETQAEAANVELGEFQGNESNLSRGFMTAAGRSLTVSAASLDREKSLLSDISVMNEDDCKNIVAQVKRGDLKNCTMHQENNKHKMLNEQHIKKLNTALVAERKEDWKTGRKVSLMGHNFTESLKKVTVPEAESHTDLDVKKFREKNYAVPVQAAKNHLSCSFETAGGKPLEISLVSVNKVEEMFDDIMDSVAKGHDYPVSSLKKEGNEGFKKSQQNADTVSPLDKKNISVYEECMKTLDAENETKRKLGTNFSVGKTDTSSFATASGRDVEISQLSLQEVNKTLAAASSYDPKEANRITIGEMGSPKKINGTSLDKVKEAAFNKTMLTPDKESKNEIKISDEKENSVHCKRLKMSCGFITAGGKKVNISEESLIKVRNLFSDVTENIGETTWTAGNVKGKEAIEDKSSEEKDVIPLGKVITSSPNWAVESKKISDSESKNDVNIHVKRQNSVDCKKLNMCGGFVTAGGKKVNVSEESLMKVRNLFSERTENVVKTTLNAGNVNRKESIEMYSLKGRDVISPTKMITVCPDSTVETNKMSDIEFENEAKILDAKRNFVNCKRLNMYGGFTTAGGKKVNVSEESLTRVRNIFSDITENVENRTLSVGNMKLQEVPEVNFSNNKNVISIEKVKNLSLNRNIKTKETSDREFDTEVNLLDTRESSVNFESQNMYGGFVTAGGKKVTVSEDSLVRVRNLFSDITENVEESTLPLSNLEGEEATEVCCVKKKDIISPVNAKTVTLNMNTGSGKISDKEFEKEVNLLEEKSINCKGLHVCGGFVTAGGKKVDVSEDSLVRVRNMFSDLTENFDNTKGKETTEWQSLKNKDELSLQIVNTPLSDRTKATKKISDSASENEANLFDKKQNFIDSKKVKMYGGFLTGCGKKVEVSEESLVKVRTLFSDIVDNEENPFEVSRNVDSLSSYMKNSCTSNTDISWKSESCKTTVPNCVENEIVDMETPLQTAHQKATAEKSKETVVSVLSTKTYVSGPPTSKNPQGNAVAENLLQHNVKINAAFKQKMRKCDTTLTQEVSESTAALLLDDDFKKELEESDSSCFSMLTERSCSPDLSLTMGSTTTIDTEPGSPVIGSRNKCNRSNKVLVRKNTTAKRSERITASVNNVCDQSRFEDKKNNTQSLIQEVNGRRKRSSSVKVNQVYKKQRLSYSNVNENVGIENDREPPAEITKASIIPSPGSWLKLRIAAQKQCVTWKDISGGNPPSQFTEPELLQFGVKKSVINVTSKTAEFFKFSASDIYREGNYQAVQAGGDKSLEFDFDGFAGIEEVEQAFLNSPNVDKSLIPAGWIRNHYRWIVWKLAATERSFPHIFASRCLTPHVLLLQLKYRYDREIDRCQRPALRRIMEHDDAPGKRMVLCVADVIKHEAQEENGKEGNKQSLKMCNYELELTDGWYSIGCTVDMEMCHLIEAGRVAIGIKLLTHSAELINCEQPCPPLEAGPSVRLKIHTNSTRRARWDCRLGYCRQPGPLPVSLSSLKPAGGVISCVTAVISRVYPIVYMEKGPDGKAGFYSAKQEALRASKRERQWQEHIEKLYSQERAQLSQLEWFSACSQLGKSKGKSNKQVSTPTRQQLAAATSAEDLCQLLFNAPDPASLQSLLSEEQQDAVVNYQQMRQQQLLQELEARVRKRIEEERNVNSSLALLKVRCLDSKDCSARSAVLSIWRPSEDLLTLFQEGSVLKLFSVTANGLRNGDLQLSACRQSRYQPQPYHPPDGFPARCATPLSQVSSGNLQTAFGELDCVGVIVHVAPLSGNYQTVYLADADMDIVGISFWNGLKGSGWEDILQQKALVACSNLQNRVGAAVHWIPTTYATEFSVFSQHPRQKHLVEALESLRRNITMDIDNFSYTCEGIVLSFLNENFVTPVRNASLNLRQTKPSTSEASRQSTPGVTPELSEKVQRRLFKLEQYGEPPSLSPLALVPRSRVLKKTFQVPLKTDQTAESSDDDSSPMSLESDDT